MSEKDKIIQFLKNMRIPYKEWDEPQFLADEAVNEGAVDSVSIRDGVDFAFDKEGKFLGTFTDQRNSYISRKIAIEEFQKLL
jgi:hypothetical protein